MPQCSARQSDANTPTAPERASAKNSQRLRFFSVGLTMDTLRKIA